MSKPVTKQDREALDVLRSWNGTNGWIVDVTISVSVGVNQAEAKVAVLKALETLGIEARECWTGR